MARVESDREDLLREAVALVRRMELQPAGDDPAIVVGYRATGWLSIYFGQDMMYQFDERGRLRRAYVDGLLYRTQGTALAQLRRQRTESETLLVRRDLEGDELAAFQTRAHENVHRLHNGLTEGAFVIARQIPLDDSTMSGDVVKSLGTVLNSPEFLAPAINKGLRGKG